MLELCLSCNKVITSHTHLQGTSQNGFDDNTAGVHCKRLLILLFRRYSVLLLLGMPVHQRSQISPSAYLLGWEAVVDADALQLQCHQACVWPCGLLTQSRLFAITRASRGITLNQSFITSLACFGFLSLPVVFFCKNQMEYPAWNVACTISREPVHTHIRDTILYIPILVHLKRHGDNHSRNGRHLGACLLNRWSPELIEEGASGIEGVGRDAGLDLLQQQLLVQGDTVKRVIAQRKAIFVHQL